MSNFTIIAYVPAIHQGYLNFFDKFPGDVFLIDSELLEDDLPRLERDIRALPAPYVAAMLETIPSITSVTVLEASSDIIALADSLRVVMPDEDVSHIFAEKYLAGREVVFEKTFLRWDKQISTTETIVPKDRVVTNDEFARTIIKHANEDASRSPDWWRQVGAAVVKNGEVVLNGHNRPYPEADYALGVFGDPRSNFDAGENIDLSKAIHAEAELIARAARDGLSLSGADLYVTTFPCPICAKSVAAAGIKRVYYEKGYSLLDAEDVLKSQGVEIVLVDTRG